MEVKNRLTSTQEGVTNKVRRGGEGHLRELGKFAERIRLEDCFKCTNPFQLKKGLGRVG